MDEAIGIGAKVAWMQLDVIDEAAPRRRLTVIVGRCLKIEIHRLGLPHAGAETNTRPTAATTRRP